MKSLFPEMESEIREDRKAQRREQVQHARHYLRDRDLSWIINRLLEKGPTSEVSLLLEVMDEEFKIEDGSKRVLDVLRDLHALWTVGKVWRRSLGIHHGSGEESFLYGLRRVHPVP